MGRWSSLAADVAESNFCVPQWFLAWTADIESFLLQATDLRIWEEDSLHNRANHRRLVGSTLAPTGSRKVAKLPENGGRMLLYLQEHYSFASEADLELSFP